jgi:hypothetical protein
MEITAEPRIISDNDEQLQQASSEIRVRLDGRDRRVRLIQSLKTCGFKVEILAYESSMSDNKEQPQKAAVPIDIIP